WNRSSGIAQARLSLDYWPATPNSLPPERTSRLRRSTGACVRARACRVVGNWSPRSSGPRISTPVPTVSACCTGTVTCRQTRDRKINPCPPTSKWVNRCHPPPSSPFVNTLRSLSDRRPEHGVRRFEMELRHRGQAWLAVFFYNHPACQLHGRRGSFRKRGAHIL